MKALSLWQPWASLVILGAKRVETRDWPPPNALLGERIAIHAAKTRDHLHLCAAPYFCDVAGIQCELPLGALLGTVVIGRASRVTEDNRDHLLENAPAEYAFGNYAVGRWGWRLHDPVPLARPVPFAGQRRFFELPDRLVDVEPLQGQLL